MPYDVLLLKIILVPLVGAWFAARSEGPRAARVWGFVSVGLTLALACALVGHATQTARAELRLDLSSLAPGLALSSDGAVAVLTLAVSLVHAGAMAFTPRRNADAPTTSALLLGEAGTMLGLLAGSPWLLFAGWCLSVWPTLAAPLVSGPARLVRGATILTIAAAWTATGLDWMSQSASTWTLSASCASIAWIVAALARLGAPPFHSWLPAALHRAPLALSAPAILSPLPVLALVHAIARAPHGLLEPLLVIGALGAMYGAVLAVVQDDVRRCIGYVQASFASTLVAAIATSTHAGAAGAILGAAVGSIALSGLMFLASAISSRTGTCDMRRLGGLHRSMPLASAAFLLCGVALVGFPGTAGFISEDLVMQSLVGGYPVATLAVLIAAALNAVTLFRTYERTYLGAPGARGMAPRDVEDLTRREMWIVILWIGLIVAAGFVPAPLTAIDSAITGAPSERPRLQ